MDLQRLTLQGPTGGDDAQSALGGIVQSFGDVNLVTHRQVQIANHERSFTTNTLRHFGQPVAGHFLPDTQSAPTFKVDMVIPAISLHLRQEFAVEIKVLPTDPLGDMGRVAVG